MRQPIITDWNDIPLVFDIPIACRILGRSQDNVKRLCQKGLLPARKVGREWRFEKTRFMRWICDGETEI